VKRKAGRPAVKRGVVFEKKLAAVAATDLAGIAELPHHLVLFVYEKIAELQACPLSLYASFILRILAAIPRENKFPL